MTKQAKARDTSNRHHPYRRQGGPDVKEKKKDPFGRNHHPFNANKKRASRYEAYLATGMQELIKGNLNDFQLHAPHRLPFAALRSAIKQAIGKQENVPQVIALLMPSVLASNECEKAFENVGRFSRELSPKDKRGGSVCFNSSVAFPKWLPALVRPPSALMAAR